MRKLNLILAVIAIWSHCDTTSIRAQTLPLSTSQPDWGEIIVQTNGTGEIKLKILNWPDKGELPFTNRVDEITSIRLVGKSVTWSLAGYSPQTIDLPPARPLLPVDIVLETASYQSTQFVGGRIVFSAHDANTVRSARARNPPSPDFDRGQATRRWNYKPTRWGMYDVELTYIADGNNQLPVEIDVAGHHFTVTPRPILQKHRFASMQVGRFYLEKSDPVDVRVDSAWKGDPLGSGIKCLTLRPAPEGGPIVQAESGAFSLPASNAITHSVLMRYEPAKIKNCMGYWMNPADWAEWVFEVKKPGTFEIEVWQGCGKGSGGSDVFVEAGGKQYPFVVEDTGHFQNFVPRRVGQVTFDKVGEQSLAIRVKRQQKGAIMDIREVKLLPVEK